MRAAGDRQQEAEARAERRSDGDGRDADAMIEGECAGSAECVLDRWIVECGLLTRLTVADRASWIDLLCAREDA